MAVSGLERFNPSVFQSDGAECLAESWFDLLFGQHALQHVFGDVGFKGPGDFLSVVPAHPLKKILGQTSDHIFLTIHIRSTETSGKHSSDMATGLQQDDAGSISSGGDSGCDPSRSCPVNNDVSGWF